MQRVPDIQICSVNMTQHVYKRARQRLRWNASTIERMAERAFTSGLRRCHTKGHLKKYLDDLYEDYKKANNLRVYGETLFIFSNNSLVTVWQLPIEFRSLARVFRIKQHKAEIAA